MAYQFHYTPTGTGVISGKEVLEQTEDAINDLSGQISGDVQTAIDTANNALNTANTASADAQNAINTANTAYTAATNAQNTANTAQNTASNALTAAQNAQNDVNALGNRVTTAEGNITQNTNAITGLTTRMGTAEGNIGNLQTAVSTAQATANTAQQTATTARQQSYVFRYSSTALTPSSTNSNTLLDNTDNLKVGDKVIDSSGVLFSITAIDTANSTFTIGTALIDLAQDSDVVHKSGDETIGGEKTFSDLHIIGYGTQYKGARNAYILPEFSAGYSGLSITTMGYTQTLKIGNFVLDVNNKPSLDTSKGYIQIATGENNGVNACTLESRNSTSSSLGTSANKWSKIYGTEYYYGSNNVEFSTKFVTTDTNQTISGNKTFSDNLTIYNSDDTVTPKGLAIRNAQWIMGESGATTVSNIDFLDKNYLKPASITASKGINGQSYLRFSVRTKDSQNTTYAEEIYYDIDTSGNVEFRSWHNNTISFGTSLYRWKDFYTNKINGVEPSSLSLSSDRSARIDISSYFTNTGSGDTNNYTVPANGYIYMEINDCITLYMYSQTTGGLTNYGNSVCRNAIGKVVGFLPVRKGDVFTSQWYTTATDVTVTSTYFIPCQGNV